MKPPEPSMRIALLLAAGLLSFAAQDASEGTANWLIIPGEAVGPISLGMSEEEVTSAVGAPERTSLGAWEYLSTGYAVLLGDESGKVSAVLAGGGNDQVRLDKRFHGRTAAGIGMGSTKQEILEALGEPSLERPLGDSVHLAYSHLGIEFMLTQNVVNWFAVRPAT